MLNQAQEQKKSIALKNLAKAFNNLGYKTELNHENGITVFHTMGTSFYIYSDYLARTRCGASYLKSKVQNYSWPIDVEPIGFDLFKPTEKIIADIEKRFLNQFIEASKIALINREAQDQQETSRQNIRHAVAKLFNEKLTPEYNDQIISGYLGKAKKHYVRADIKSDGLTNLSLSDLSLEQIEKIRSVLILD